MPTLPRSHGPTSVSCSSCSRFTGPPTILLCIAALPPVLHLGLEYAMELGRRAHIRWATAPVEWFFGSISCPEPDGTLCIIRRLCPCPCANLSSLDNLSFLLRPCANLSS
eukprot:EG_transcript_63103